MAFPKLVDTKNQGASGLAMPHRNKDIFGLPELAFEQLAGSLTGGDAQAQAVSHLAVIGAAESVGATTVAHNLAKVLAASGSRVLLMTVQPSAQEDGAHEPASNHQDLLKTVQTRHEGFFYARIPAARLPRPVLEGHDVLAQMMDDIQKDYDYVIWDLPPVDRSVQSRAVCKHTQGVLMVVHAGKTRWHAAKNAVERLTLSGATMLGVVLNQKRAYIPEWIYRLLFRYGASS